MWCASVDVLIMMMLLQSLRLNSALHSWRQLEAVAELCRSVPGILDISLADNCLGVESAAAVAKVLRAAAPSLAALDLSNNALKLKAMQVDYRTAPLETHQHQGQQGYEGFFPKQKP